MREAVAYVRSGAGTCDRPRPRRADPLALELRPAGALSHARGARRRARRRSAAPLPQAAPRHGPDQRGGAPRRSRRRTRRRTRRRATAPAQAPEPDPATIFEHVVPEPWRRSAGPTGLPDGTGEEQTLVQAINATLKEEFRANPDTFIWGQDVAYRDKGGVFNVTKGMQQEFGAARVFNAPIAEDFIMGTADGFCRLSDDIRVVVEGAEFADYFWPAAEQMVEMSHEYWRTNGQFVPERDRAPRLGRLHRRRPLPLPEHRGLADDAARSPDRRPGVRRRRGRPAAHRDPLPRHHALPRAEVPLQQPDGARPASRRSSPFRSARRASAARERTSRSSRTARPSTSPSRRRRRSRTRALPSRSSTCARSFRSTSRRS